jgi:hypothetical protein
MGPARDEATAGPRTALAGLVAGFLAAALALLAPSLLSVGAPSSVGLAMVALVLAALVRRGHHGAVLASRTVPTRFPATREASPILTARVTDPVHHPLRPRAPGPA